MPRSNGQRPSLAVVAAAVAMTTMTAMTTTFTSAFPSSAGSCKPGTEALLQALTTTPDEGSQIHYLPEQFGTTQLSDFNLTISINNETLQPDLPFDFFTRQDHNISLQSTSPQHSQFKGFLIRLASPNDRRTFTSLRPNINDTDVQESQQCTDVARVGGICHTNPEPKTDVHGILRMDQLDDDMILDVTVVIQTDVDLNISRWYYSQYILNAVAMTAAPSHVPTSAMTPSPTSLATSLPSQLPTSLPTQAPSDGSDAMRAGSFIGHAVVATATTILVLSSITLR